MSPLPPFHRWQTPHNGVAHHHSPDVDTNTGRGQNTPSPPGPPVALSWPRLLPSHPHAQLSSSPILSLCHFKNADPNSPWACGTGLLLLGTGLRCCFQFIPRYYWVAVRVPRCGGARLLNHSRPEAFWVDSSMELLRKKLLWPSRAAFCVDRSCVSSR